MIVVVVVAALGVAAFVSAHFSPWAVNRRKLLATHRRAIAELGDGYARIVGTVVATETIAAPVSGRACVYYELVVEERADPEAKFRRRAGQRGFVPFLVEDATRRAVVVPDLVTTVLTRATVLGAIQPSNLYEDAIEDTTGIATRLRTKLLLSSTPEQRFVEMRIEPGAVISVAGHAVEEPDPDPRVAAVGGYRGGAAMRLRLVGSRALPLMISDRPETTA